MKKTYITSMPDHMGAFLRASRILSDIGINITRVSYNKAVDSHALFIDAEGTESQLLRADEELEKIGYLENRAEASSIVLVEFMLRDVPGSVTGVLELIREYRFNIAYISSQENGTDYQYFKMGLSVDRAEELPRFLAEAEKLCRVRIIDYNHTEKVYDNSIFYNTFVSGLTRAMGLSEEHRKELLVQVNLAMQTLDEHGLSPYRTFDSIGKFAELLAASKGEAFSPRITEFPLTEATSLTLIEPPCGSNTAILKHGEEALFIDSGYACYREEMLPILRRILPGFDGMEKKILITHADVDHVGLLPLFDQVIVSRKSARCMGLESRGENGFREENPLHKPYISICKALTGFEPADPDRLVCPWRDPEECGEPLVQIGFFDFCDMHFEVYEGSGGHMPGEVVLIDYAHHVAFTGDVYVNLKGMTARQAEYNRYAPILMTSVDTNKDECARERAALLQRLGAGEWKIFGGHGYKKDYAVKG